MLNQSDNTFFVKKVRLVTNRGAGVVFIQIQNRFCQSRVVKEFEGGEGEIEGSGGIGGW